MLVGVDIGTSKVVAVVAETRGEDVIEIVGLGTYPSKGLKNGVVVDIESTTYAIKKSIAEAESMAGCHIGSCYVGISGSHIRGLNSEGVVPIKDGEVRYGDVDRVIETAQAMAIPADRLYQWSGLSELISQRSSMRDSSSVVIFWPSPAPPNESPVGESDVSIPANLRKFRSSSWPI